MTRPITKFGHVISTEVLNTVIEKMNRLDAFTADDVQRMLEKAGVPLGTRLEPVSYRAADTLLQRLRKGGVIYFSKAGRHWVRVAK